MAEEVDILLEKIKASVLSINDKMKSDSPENTKLPPWVSETIQSMKGKMDQGTVPTPIKKEVKKDAEPLQQSTINQITNILNKQPPSQNIGLPPRATAEMRDNRPRGLIGRTFDRASGWLSNAPKHENYGDPDSMVARGNRLDQRGGKWGTLGKVMSGAGSMMKGFQDPSQLSGAGSFLRGAGKMAGAIPGLGKIAGPAGAFADVLLKSVNRLQKWNEELHASNMQFAEFSGAMAKVQADQLSRDIKLSQERGDRRASSAQYLAEGKSGLQQRTSKIEDIFANLSNYVGGFLSKMTTGIIDAITFGLFKDKSQKGGGELDMNEWVEQVSRTAWYEAYGEPADWKEDPWHRQHHRDIK